MGAAWAGFRTRYFRIRGQGSGGIQGRMEAKNAPQKSNGPELGISGPLHSEKWRWEGTHRQGCCLYWIYNSNFGPSCPVFFRYSCKFFENFSRMRILASAGGFRPKKKPRAGYLGASCTQRSGGGRGLTAKDAVCIGSILPVFRSECPHLFLIFLNFFCQPSQVIWRPGTLRSGTRGGSWEA